MTASLKTLQGGTRLLFDAIQGITNTTEQVHKDIAGTPQGVLTDLPASSAPHGFIAAGVYGLVRGINGGLREGVDKSFGLLPDEYSGGGINNGELRAVSAINGICGDHLEATGNTLAISMSLRTVDQPLELTESALRETLPQASPHIVVMVHGLCLSELSWRPDECSGIGARLENSVDCTPLYLRYNTGRHISTNGREFSQLLESLCAEWPVPVQSISLVGHSMGGLIIRSASCHAQEHDSLWLQQLQKVICLGTPHHGSPLEKAGHAFELAIKKLPFAQPLLMGTQRSAGIKDLRHGALVDSDWEGHDPDSPRPDSRRVVPLVAGVDYYFAAASLGRDDSDPLGHLLGDLLVRSESAVGLHKNELRSLDIDAAHCRVFHERNHFDLLTDDSVQAQVVEWLAS